MKKRFTSTVAIAAIVMATWSTVAGSAQIWVEPNSFDVNVVQGCTLTKTLTIGNDGAEDLNFIVCSQETSREELGSLSAGRTDIVATSATEKTMVLEYEFGEPIITKKGGYDLVQIQGLEMYERTGAPIVPVRPVRLLLPFGKKVAATRVIPLSTRELLKTYRLPPGQETYPLNYNGPVKHAKPNPAIYNRAAPWPGREHERVASQSKRGYQLLTVNLFPIQYIPATGKLEYTSKLRLEIDLADSRPARVPRPTKKTISAISSIVDNPKLLSSYPEENSSVGTLGASALAGGGPYQYVIITSPALESAPGPWNFQALRDAKISKGMTATIVTTSWIYVNYSGSDNQTRIRNFLIDAYQTWGTEYVLLGGTNAIIPSRLFREYDEHGLPVDIPADMYYGCVDPMECTFDYDADGVYGEATDGVGGSDVDLYAEIYVGRAAVENATELQNFIKKTLIYNSIYSEYLQLITMLGEYIGFGGVSEYAKPSLEQIRLGGNYDGYFTYGFENHLHQTFYDFNTSTNLYDDESTTWDRSDLADLMNAGTHIFNHLGHGAEQYLAYNKDFDVDYILSELHNTDYFFVYSQACLAGAFDTTNCFAEVITSMEHGAFAVVMNARLGYGKPESTDGPSHRFNRQFWDAALGEGKLELGRANQDSKEDNLWDINGNQIRYCYYELTLFGDPEQQLRFKKDSEWISVEPEEGTVGPGDSNETSITFRAIKNGMEMAPGVYEANIIIISNDPCSPTIVPVTMTVSKDDLQVIPAEGFQSSGAEGGPFEPMCMKYTLTNINDTETVNWTTSETEDWLDVDPNFGVLDPCESMDVNVCILPVVELFEPNFYTGTAIFRNSDGNSIKPRTITLKVRLPDHFTETFNATNTDLDNLMLTFSPDGSAAYYEACRQKVGEFPTDPNGGTYVPLWDDDYTVVILGNGKEVLFYGQWYDQFYIGSNGYITFGAGDTEYRVTLENHFNMPRISGVFADLNPPNDQCISFKQLDDRVAVTFQEVELRVDKDAKCSFQVEMFFVDGTIRITWLDMAATSAVAGLSEGNGISPVFFEESDLSRYPACLPMGDFNRDYTVNFKDFAILAAHWLDVDCGIPLWCGKTDLDFSGETNEIDLDIFSENWLTAEDWFLKPIAHWKFDEGDGTISYDSSENGNEGTLVNGPQWTTSQIEGALLFDGEDDYVVVGDRPAFNNLPAITISAWVRADEFPNSYPTIVNKAKSTYSNVKSFDLAVEESTGKVYFAAGGKEHKSSGLIEIGRLYHIAATFDSDSNQMEIYINGAPDSSATNADNFVNTPGQNIYIGSFDPNISSTRCWCGLIDDVRLYDRALSAEEIQQLYHEGLSRKATDPNPPDGAINIESNAILSWTAGYEANSHDVYLGTNFDDVNDATVNSNEYMGNFDVNSFDPCGLDREATYYWRIDERNPQRTVKGDVWTFDTYPAPNLVGWWKFEEGAGIIAYDSSGNDNTGTAYGGPNWVIGKVGDYALDFNGISDYVNSDALLDLSAQTGVTISAWMKNVNDSPDYAGVDIGTRYSGSVSIRAIPDKRYQAIMEKGYSYIKSSSVVKNSNTWFYVVGVFDNTSAKIYIDGVYATDSQESAGSISFSDLTGSAADNLYVGAHSGVLANDNLNQWFNGTIDDVRVYNRALSAEEIWQIYQHALN